MLIINADDWGRDRVATDTTLACYEQGRITSTSAMVFMEDSGRAADLAKSAGLDVGLHINFTETFSQQGCPDHVSKRQQRLRRFLKASKYALLLYSPFLAKDFRAVFDAQLQEFTRLYGQPPSHFDGHQHMHLATNMLAHYIIPAGQKVRRSFSFRPGQKSLVNRAYRRAVDWRLSRRYRMPDFFFALSANLESVRLQPVVALATVAHVELMTHTWNQPEYDFLMSNASIAMFRGARTGPYAAME